MNIEQAKGIPLSFILGKIGSKPTRKSEKDEWYLSPIRNEKTASFHLSLAKNLWYDHGIGVGGTIIDFGCIYLASQKQSNSVSDSLNWLKEIAGDLVTAKPLKNFSKEIIKVDPTLTIKSVKSLKHVALINYLNKRGIPQSIAMKALKEVRIHNRETNKNIFALGIQNEEDGYEVRNTFFKGCVGQKHITFIRGNNSASEGLNFFEGFMDYLTVLTLENGKPLQHDTIILNSLACIKLAFPYFKSYGYKVAYTWLDNDDAGKKATLYMNEIFKAEEDLTHRSMNHMYAPYKDVNAWHMHKLGL